MTRAFSALGWLPILALGVVGGCKCRGTSGRDKLEATLPPGVERQSADELLRLRDPAAAGRFYPDETQLLERTVDSLLSGASDCGRPSLRALVAPHAGYQFSGPTAAVGYKCVQGEELDTVIDPVSSHRHAFQGASVLDVEAYRPPLGLVPLALLAATLRREDLLSSTSQAHRAEHSLEVQLPFLAEHDPGICPGSQYVWGCRSARGGRSDCAAPLTPRGTWVRPVCLMGTDYLSAEQFANRRNHQSPCAQHGRGARTQAPSAKAAA